MTQEMDPRAYAVTLALAQSHTHMHVRAVAHPHSCIGARTPLHRLTQNTVFFSNM